ncbi:MAG: endonuclease domain-containing protein [Ignavibacteria bacterium]|nr:endonuclease domain-containing protein [Ignavibacteria bacterium]
MPYLNLHKYKTKRQELRKNSSKAEQILWSHLKGSNFLNLKFRRQHGIGRYVADLYCPEIRFAIEIDGDSHFNSDAKEYDKLRTEYFTANDIEVIRFTNEAVYKNISGVLEELQRVIRKNKRYKSYDHPLSPSSREEGGIC